MKLTPEILNKICPSLGNKAIIISDTLNKITPNYGMDSADILEDFIPNLLVESGEFTTFEENLNYSTDALIAKFGRHRISEDAAKEFGRNSKHKADQQSIANCLYGGKWGEVNLGNTQVGDGWTFRGAGPIQGTGRGLISSFAVFYNTKFGTNYSPEQIAIMMRDKVNIEIGIHFACWLFSIAKNLIQMSIDDNFKGIIKKINGGYNGIDERTSFYNKCKIHLKD